MRRPTSSDYAHMAEFIPHPHVRDLWTRLADLRARRAAIADAAQPPNLMVTGESGLGKSWGLREYARQNAVRHGTECEQRPVVYVETPHPFAVGNLYQSIMDALAVPFLRTRPSTEEKLRITVGNLAAQQVEMLIIDELQHLGKGATASNGMESMKHLANRSSSCLVLCGLPKIEAFRNADEQYYRRFPIFRMTPYSACDREFISLIANMGKRFLIGPDSGWWAPSTGVPQAIHAMTEGYVWRLMELFVWIKSAINPTEDFFTGPVPLELVKDAYAAWKKEDRGDPLDAEVYEMPQKEPHPSKASNQREAKDGKPVTQRAAGPTSI